MVPSRSCGCATYTEQSGKGYGDDKDKNGGDDDGDDAKLSVITA